MALFPIVPLAVGAAVKSLLALGAALMFEGGTLGTGAEAALLVDSFALVLPLVLHGRIEFTLLSEPLLGRVVHPGV